MVISMFAEMMKIMEIWHFSRSEPHHTPRKKKENWPSTEKTKETILRICKQVCQVFRGLFLGNKRHERESAKYCINLQLYIRKVVELIDFSCNFIGSLGGVAGWLAVSFC